MKKTIQNPLNFPKRKIQTQFSFANVSFPKRKVAQQEIIGLLIIIILLVFGVLTFVTLSYKNPSLPTVKDVSKSTSMLNIISKVTLCTEINLEEAVKLCSQSLNACNKNACELVREETEKMLKLLLKPKETFKISIKEENKDVLEFGECKGDIITSSRNIQTQISGISLKLALCNQ